MFRPFNCKVKNPEKAIVHNNTQIGPKVEPWGTPNVV